MVAGRTSVGRSSKVGHQRMDFESAEGRDFAVPRQIVRLSMHAVSTSRTLAMEMEVSHDRLGSAVETVAAERQAGTWRMVKWWHRWGTRPKAK